MGQGGTCPSRCHTPYFGESLNVGERMGGAASTLPIFTTDAQRTQRMKPDLIGMVASFFAKIDLMNFVWVLVGVAGLVIVLFILKPRG